MVGCCPSFSLLPCFSFCFAVPLTTDFGYLQWEVCKLIGKGACADLTALSWLVCLVCSIPLKVGINLERLSQALQFKTQHQGLETLTKRASELQREIEYHGVAQTTCGLVLVSRQ